MSEKHNDTAYAVHFTRLEPLPDPQHGSPCTRSSHGLSLLTLGKDGRDSGVLVLIGGEHVARTPLSFDEFVWVAEPVVADDGKDKLPTTSWKWRNMRNFKSNNLPPLRVAHAQAAVGESVYIFGGRSGIDMGENAMNDLWKFHIPSETWTMIESQSEHVPEARSFHRMIAIGKKIFVCGGCGASGRLKDLHEFDLNTSTWTDHGSSSLLAGRGGPNVLPFRDLNTQQSYIAIVAGFKGEESNDGHICRESKESEWKWDKELMGSLDALRPRSVCVAGVFGESNLGIVFGGEVDPSDRGHEGAGGFANDVVLLDGNNECSILQQLTSSGTSEPWPEARGWSDGESLEKEDGSKCLYFFGGLAGNDSNPKRLDDLWLCQIKNKE
jgi:hypothetical protein